MSLTIIKDLPAYLLTKNQAELKYLKRGIYTTAGSYAEYYYEPNLAVFVDGNTWALSWAGHSLEIMITAADSDLPNEIIEQGALSDNDYMLNVLAPGLAAIAEINEDFIVEAVSYDVSARKYIRFRARKKGSDYSLSTTGSTVTFTSTISNAGVTPVKADDYKIKLPLMVEMEPGLSNYQRIKILEATGEANEATNEMEISFYDIPALLQQYYQVKPPADPYSILKREVLLRRFRCDYYEFANETDYKRKTGTEKFIVQAGLDLEHQAEIFTDYTFRNSAIYFLTNQQRVKYISRNQPEWLMFYGASFAGNTLSIETNVYFDNGTTQQAVTAWNDDWYGNLILVPASVKQLRLEQYETGGRVITHYTVQVMKDNGITTTSASELMKYIVDPRKFRDEKFLVFENSFGGLDTLRCTGRTELGIETEQEISEKLSTGNAEDGLQNMSGKFDCDKWKLNTGEIRESDLTWINDFLRSQFIWEAMAKPAYNTSLTNSYRQRYKKMIVTSKKYPIDEMTAFRWAVEIEAQYAWDDNSVTAGSILNEKITDDYIEFVITNNDNAAHDLDVSFNGDVKNVEYNINGAVEAGMTSFAETITMEAGEAKHIRVSMKHLTQVDLLPDSASDLSITWKHISFYKLERLQFVSFLNNSAAFFIENLRYARKLDFLGMSLTGTAADTDAILREMKFCYDSFGLLTDLTVEGIAPSLAGAIDKAYLNGEGVTVITS